MNQYSDRLERPLNVAYFDQKVFRAIEKVITTPYQIHFETYPTALNFVRQPQLFLMQVKCSSERRAFGSETKATGARHEVVDSSPTMLVGSPSLKEEKKCPIKFLHIESPPTG
jgi:hypothetical protein